MSYLAIGDKIWVRMALFKKKLKPTVTVADKEWIESYLLWLVEIFGLEKIHNGPFIFPQNKAMQYSNLAKPKQLEDLIKKLCIIFEIDHKIISVELFDDLGTKQWASMPLGSFNLADEISEKRKENSREYSIKIAKSFFIDGQLLVKVLARDLAKIKLLRSTDLKLDSELIELIAELAAIYWGFGIFVANTRSTSDPRGTISSGYLPNQMVSYANACLIYIAEANYKKYLPSMSPLISDLFVQDSKYLIKTDDTKLTPERLRISELRFETFKLLKSGYKGKAYFSIIQSVERLLEITPNDTIIQNNYGYALLQMKRYAEAIIAFDKAIEADPYWSFPINNRGYAKLQMGDFENAYIGLAHSYRMEPENSFSHRNLGVYYLMKDNPKRALEFLKKAVEMDPETDTIHFFLGKAYEANSMNAEAEIHYSLSVEKEENNDSIL